MADFDTLYEQMQASALSMSKASTEMKSMMTASDITDVTIEGYGSKPSFSKQLKTLASGIINTPNTVVGAATEADLFAIHPTTSNVVGMDMSTGAMYLWNGSTWTKTVYQQTDVIKYINDLMGFTSIPLTDLTGANYIVKATGERVSSTSWRNSTYIAVKKNQKISLTAANNSADFANIAFYDVDQVFISADNVGVGTSAFTKAFSAPADGFIILATRVATSTTFECDLINFPATKADLATLSATLTAQITAGDIASKAYTDELVGYTDVPLSVLTGANYIVPTDGTLVASTQWKNSTYLGIVPGQKIAMTAVCLSDQQANIAFYDANKVFISSDRVSADNTVATKMFTAPANSAFCIVCTRTGTSTTFSCHLLNKALTADKLDKKSNPASYDTAMKLSLGSQIVKAMDGAVNLAKTPGYINAAGAITAGSTSRNYFMTVLQAGESVYYDVYGRQSQTTNGDIPLVLWIPDGGSPTEIKGNPLTLSGAQRDARLFTATAPGTLYINSYNTNATTNAAETSTAIKGIVGNSLLYRQSVLTTDDLDEKVVSRPLHERDTQAIIANGVGVPLTGKVEYEYDRVLYKNGSKQITDTPTSLGVWAIAYIPVRTGDTVTVNAWFDTSTTSTLTYLSQLDVHKKYVQSLLDDFGSAGQFTRSVTAVADGFIAVRIRRMNGTTVLNHTLMRTSPQYFSGGGSGSSADAPIVTASMDLLPIELDSTWLYNSPSYQQDGIVVRDNYIYVVCIAKGRIPHILQRKVQGGEWKVFDLSTIPGNPFTSPNTEDGHNSFSIAVTKDGYILVTGNHHAVNCKCVISDNPHDITSWTQTSYTDATVTYPRFLRYPDGTLQAFWRQGSSGNGTYYMATFNDATRLFGPKRLVIDNPEGGNPYEQTIVVDNAGVLHICWGYRTTGSTADSNYGMFYGKSADKGTTFTNAAGDISYPVPMSNANAERPVVVNQASGYVNQNGACADLNGRFHTVYWQLDANGYTQIIHLFFNGTSWQTETASRFTYTEVTSGSLLNGTSSRPQICCTRYGKIFIVYRTTEDGRAGKIRAINVTTPGVPSDNVLVAFDVNRTELSLNVWDILQTGIIRMMLYRGLNRPTSAPANQTFKSEPVWLMQAALP